MSTITSTSHEDKTIARAFIALIAFFYAAPLILLSSLTNTGIGHLQNHWSNTTAANLLTPISAITQVAATYQWWLLAICLAGSGIALRILVKNSD